MTQIELILLLLQAHAAIRAYFRFYCLLTLCDNIRSYYLSGRFFAVLIAGDRLTATRVQTLRNQG